MRSSGCSRGRLRTAGAGWTPSTCRRRAPRPPRAEGLSPRTLFEKVWERHLVAAETAATPAVLYIDLHLIHEVTSPQAFALLRERGLAVRRVDLTLATMDHSTPTRTSQV